MENEGSLTRSQQPVACPYRQPDQSTHPPIFKDPLSIILPPMLGIPNSKSHHQNSLHRTPLPHVANVTKTTTSYTRWFKYDRENCHLFTHKLSRSYLNHLVLTPLRVAMRTPDQQNKSHCYVRDVVTMTVYHNRVFQPVFPVHILWSTRSPHGRSRALTAVFGLQTSSFSSGGTGRAEFTPAL